VGYGVELSADLAGAHHLSPLPPFSSIAHRPFVCIGAIRGAVVRGFGKGDTSFAITNLPPFSPIAHRNWLTG